jgi:hypothetical protein
MKSILVALLVLTACTVGESTGTGTQGGTGGTAPDAAAVSTGSNGNNNGSGSGATTAACTGAAYDPCTDNTQCMSGNCKTFGGAGLQVCTVTCTVGNDATCLINGVQGTCNNMGICKPPAANSCTR